jgi:3-phenylpropionate/trans-cinnamate dioxygenase ferredoxin reductase subunit
VRTTVVLGAGQAGCQAVSTLREEGYAGRLVLLGSEEHLPYQRPPLSKGHLTGTTPRETLFLRPEAWFVEQQVELRLSTVVTEVDRAAKVVRLEDGEEIGYDVLVLALGARHRELGLPGTDLEGVLALRTLSEADAVRASLEAATDVVVVGGGFIGMEVAATAAKLGKTTSVLELAPQLMGRVLTAETAAFLVDAHRRRGLTVELATSLRSFVHADGKVTGVVTSDGRTLPADLVVLGIGAVAECDLALKSGLDVDDGVVVDEHLRTSDPAIYAIGDCANGPNPFAQGRSVRLESVQNAVAQAHCAALGILGRPQPYDSVPWFWSDQADLKLQIAGLTRGHDTVVVTGSLAEERFSTWCFAGDELIGVESVNRLPDHMAARKLLTNGSSLTPAQVAAADFDARAAAKA